MGQVTEFSASLVTEDGTEHVLAGEMKVGRVAECDITIEDPKVSRAHAMIRVEGERVTVEDLGSANGSRINDKRAEGVAGLSDGDTLSFENHHLTVVITGVTVDEDQTVVNLPDDDDATVVGGYTPAEPEPAPEPAAAAPPPAPEPAPEPPPAPAAPKSAAASSLPGSWVEDEDDGEHTQILMPGTAADSAMESHVHDRESEQAHLQVIVEGNGTDLFELEISGGTDPDVWEVGRAETCQIALSDPSVSSRHAQLIHQNGRWRLVNLVSANGIYVNEEKRLTAYLGDGDKIRLGMANLVFRTAVGAAAAAAPAPSVSSSTSAADGGGGKSKLIYIGIGVVVIGLALAAWKML